MWLIFQLGALVAAALLGSHLSLVATDDNFHFSSANRRTSKDFRIPGSYIIHLEPSHTHDQVEALINDRFYNFPQDSQHFLSRDVQTESRKRSPRIIHRYSELLHGFSVEDLDNPDDLRDIPGILHISPDSLKWLRIPSWGIDRIDQVFSLLKHRQIHTVRALVLFDMAND
jgi:hypothetical protein